jgi:hypothetical protein
MYILADFFLLRNFTFLFRVERFSFHTGKIITDLHSILGMTLHGTESSD